MRNIIVEEIIQTPVEDQKIELVERKGIGHPDSLSDGIAESVSRALCREYLERFGTIMHHNTDEVQLTAGMSSPKFGGGEVIKPIQILLTGRGTANVGGEQIGIDRIAIAAAKEYLNDNIINLDVETCTIIECKIGHGSADLVNVFERKDHVPAANDTSFGVGYAPFSETENIVLESEHMINSASFKSKFPEVGEDIKVMGLRENDRINLTIAAAMVSKDIDNLDHYISVKEELKDRIMDLALKHTDKDVDVNINTADDYEKASVYLTVTGTSAEMGDDGSVGRGNRANGLITPNRPMSMEATSGKNPVNHVGKIYNLLSTRIANDIAESVDGIKEVQIRILSQIGKPIDHPKAASAQLILQDGYRLEDVKKKVEGIIDCWLEDVTEVTNMVIEGELKTF